MSITTRAADALARARAAGYPADPPTATSPHIRRTRARIARHVVAMLGAEPGHVRVVDDPIRRPGGTLGHLIIVDDPDDLHPDDLHPDDPHADDHSSGLRLIPETGNEIMFCLLGPCPDCGGEVPVAPIADLIDLALHRERWTRARRGDPGDTWPESVPVEFDHDPGHRDDCAIGHAH